MGCSLRLQKFCCCCSLRTGTLVIGTAGWIFTLIQIILAPVHAAESEESKDFDSPISPEFTDTSLFTRICMGLVSLLVCVLLIVGVYKKNNKFMLPWLVLECLGIIILSIGALIILGIAFLMPGGHLPIFLILFVVIVLVTVLECYCWLCVWSHYMELQERDAHVSPNVQYQTPSYIQAPPAYDKDRVPLA